MKITRVSVGLSSSVIGGTGSILNASTLPDGAITILLPPSAFSSNSSGSHPIDMVFSTMTSSALYPLTNKSSASHAVASTVLSLTVLEKDVINLQDNVTIVLQLHSKVNYSFMKAYLCS